MYRKQRFFRIPCALGRVTSVTLVVGTLLCLALSAPAFGQVIYSEGPIDGNDNAFYTTGPNNPNFLGSVQDISNGFIAANSGTPGTLEFAMWVFTGDTPTTMSYELGTSAFGTDLGSGTNALSCPSATCVKLGNSKFGTHLGSGTNALSCPGATCVKLGYNSFGYDVWDVTVPVNSGAMTAGQVYWVSISNTNDNASSGSTAWDIPDGGLGGPATCNFRQSGTNFGNCGLGGESFTLSSVPPPPACFGSGGGLQIIHDFTAQDLVGWLPNGVTIDKVGNLYGTGNNGGNNGLGMAYRLSPKGQDWVFTPLYSFTGGSKGAGPGTVIVGPGGALYGDTPNGGIQNCGSNGSSYCGLVYRLRPTADAVRTAMGGSWIEDVLYQFAGGNDTSDPNDRLVSDEAGNLYGTTAGAVFKLTPSGGGWTEQVLYSFTGNDSGPYSLVFGSDGNLYGGVGGGAYGFGAVFQLVPTENGWTEQDIYSFPGNWQSQQFTEGPQSLVQDASGNLYGVAYGFDQGWYSHLVFMLSPTNGDWAYSVLYSFQDPYEGYDETWIEPLAIDATGDVYFSINHATPCPRGSCSAPAPDDYVWGAVMMRPPGGNGFQELWYSGNDVAFSSVGPLAVDANGNVYGTTKGCGEYGLGTIWKVY
jgi:hypothetical protein